MLLAWKAADTRTFFRDLWGENRVTRRVPALAHAGLRRLVAMRLRQAGASVMDQWSRQRPILEVGTEFMSRALEDWAFARGVQLDFIRPGKLVENAFIEAFNGRLRDECLNVHQFTSIEDARAKIEAWRVDYNARRPHSSLGLLTPNEFVAQRQAERAARSGIF